MGVNGNTYTTSGVYTMLVLVQEVSSQVTAGSHSSNYPSSRLEDIIFKHNHHLLFLHYTVQMNLVLLQQGNQK